MYFADLHVHTTVSDCSEDVSVILNMAKETGITHIAFTDHDTTKMAPEHISRAEAMGISAISGVEMSACDYDSGIRAHILGYGYVTTSHIEKIGAETLRKRNENCLRQMEILRQLGYTIGLYLQTAYTGLFAEDGTNLRYIRRCVSENF